MNHDTETMLKRILLNQVAIYKRLDEIQGQLKGSQKSAPGKSYAKDLSDEAEKIKTSIDSDSQTQFDIYT